MPMSIVTAGPGAPAAAAGAQLEFQRYADAVSAAGAPPNGRKDVDKLLLCRYRGCGGLARRCASPDMSTVDTSSARHCVRRSPATDY